MYKVFINDSSLEFTSEASEKSIPYENGTQLKKLFKELDSGSQNSHLRIHTDDIQDTWRTWIGLFEVIEAAGAVVKNNEGKILMIFRRGKWDLPKGKLEVGEGIEAAAKREAMEECGIPEPKITKRLQDTYHTYKIEDQPILKRTYWFEMYLDGEVEPEPQLEEEITNAEWCGKDAISQNLQNTFGNIDLLLQPYLPD